LLRLLAGLLSIASSSFLIAITQREQVAQICGKPIYAITDVAIVPLASQIDANKAIAAAVESLHATDTTSTDTDTDVSDTEVNHHSTRDHPEPETPIDQPSPQKQPPSNPTSIARDVIANRGQYGRFAAQWFSKQGWGEGNSSTRIAGSKKDTQAPDTRPSTESDAAPGQSQPQGDETIKAKETDDGMDARQSMSSTSIVEVTPKILRRTRMLLTSGSYFFSYEFDLTRKLALMNGKMEAPSRDSLDPLVGHQLSGHEEVANMR
jgi:hypothetical protein